jgi:flagellar basal-body rod modification protein FlgD
MTTSATTSVGNNLSQKDFLQLLTTQLKNQDPLKPMDNTEFIAQLAQFTSLQQTTDISQTLTSLSSSLKDMGAVGYLGKQVTINDTEGNTITGIVTEVGSDVNNRNVPAITVNGKVYDLSSVSSVSIPPTKTP